MLARVFPRLKRVDDKASSEPVIRAVVAIVIGLVIILFPNTSLAFTVGIVGLGLLVTGLYSATAALRRRDRERLGRGLLTAFLGAGLFLVRQWSGALIVGSVALVLVAGGLFDLYRALRGWRSGGEVWFASLKALGQLVAAVALIVLGEFAIIGVLLVVGGAWVLAGCIHLWRLIDPELKRSESQIALADTPELAESWLRRRDIGNDQREAVVDRLIFQGAQYWRRVRRFTALMGFSAAIAAFGIQTDSTAVVIGAMLVAPLMTPILATSSALLMGWPAHVTRSLVLVGLGIVIAVGVSFLIARYAPGIVEVTQNSQVTSRTSPTLLDLMIALAAGGAGGYAVCRPDVSDSLPGVAIAVALVPPLAVVGITVAAGEFGLAAGALLLFATNLVGIILASSAVFVFVGFLPWEQMQANRDQLRQSLFTVLAALAIVAIPLSFSGSEILTSAADRNGAVSATQEWVATQSDLEFIQLELDGDTAEIAVIGPRVPTDVDGLAEAIAAKIDRKITVDLSFIPRERITAQADGS